MTKCILALQRHTHNVTLILLLVDNTITYWMFVEQISNGKSQLINNAEDKLTIKTSTFFDIPTSHSILICPWLEIYFLPSLWTVHHLTLTPSTSISHFLLDLCPCSVWNVHFYLMIFYPKENSNFLIITSYFHAKNY